MKKISKVILILLIIGFLALYFAYQNGYHERMQQKKINITNQQIEQFELDIKEGRDVSIESYHEEAENYSTKLGKASLNLAGNFENAFDRVIKYLFEKLGNVVE